MAGVHTYKQKGKEETIIAIDHSVGRASRNKTDDVQLIQWMINSAAERLLQIANSPVNATDIRIHQIHNSIDKMRALKIDGICGQKTIEAIYAAQKAMNVYRHCQVDGRIDAMKDGISSQYENIHGDFQFNCMYLLAVLADQGRQGKILDFGAIPEPLRTSLLKSIIGARGMRFLRFINHAQSMPS